MEQINKIDEYRGEIINSLQELIQIRSVSSAPTHYAPFGVGVHEALLYMLKLGEEEGFSVLNTDNKGGHVEIGQGEETIGILVHLDVVPAGNDWEQDPFGGEIVDGKIYGRGTIDDKGPAIAAFYAMKALKDIELNKKVRLIFGLDEELGIWKSIGHYLEKAGTPEIGFTPDSSFPVTHAEMGLLIFDIVKKIGKSTSKGLVLKSINGGNAHNMVPDWCQTVISSEFGYEEIKEKIKSFRSQTGYNISCKGRGRAFEINTTGISAHGAHPDKGLNAISIMMSFLKTLTFTNEDVNEFLEFYSSCIDFDLCGSKMDCCLEDEISGKLIFNVGVAKTDRETMNITVNIRYPVSLDGEDVYVAIRPVLNKYNLGVVKIEDKKSINMPTDSYLVKTLMDVYKEHTGDTKTKPMVIGGGTYARAMPNCVAFGLTFPHQEGREHQKNEYIEIEDLIKASKIYVDTIYRLANG